MKYLRAAVIVCVALLFAPPQAISQTIQWSEVHKFSPPDANWPEVVSLSVVKDGRLFAGLLLSPGALQMSSDGGGTWISQNLDGAGGGPVSSVVLADNGDLIATSWSLGITISQDSGNTWSNNLSPGLPTTSSWSTGSSTILAAVWEQGLFRSNDSGSTWTSISSAWRSVSAIGMCMDDVLLVSIQPDGVEYRSIDGGTTWENVDFDGSTNSFFNARDNVMIAAGTTGVWRSSDCGNTWINVHVFGSGGTSGVASIAGNKEGMLFFASSQAGISVSIDNGETWTFQNDGLSLDNRFGALAVDPDGFVYAGTQNGHIFRTIASTHVSTFTGFEPPTQLVLHPVYPNPVESKSRLDFDLDRGANVLISVYDVLGRLVQIVDQRFLSSGAHSIEFDAANLRSGVYMFSVQTEKRKMTQTFLVKK